jgi:cytochrome c553
MRCLGMLFIALLLAGARPDPAQAQTLEERTQLCLACHGERGQSETPETPSLGGQPSMYVLIQLFMFRQKLRTVEIMNEMAKGLSDADLQKLADLVAKLPPPKPLEDRDAARVRHGQNLIVKHRCAFCHNNLSGADAVPRIAAQREDYLLKALRDYKSGARREYQPVMAEIMPALSDSDIADLAYFLSRTGAP